MGVAAINLLLQHTVNNQLITNFKTKMTNKELIINQSSRYIFATQ